MHVLFKPAVLSTAALQAWSLQLHTCFFAYAGISYMTSAPVTAADLAGKSLSLASGGPITYDSLIIATGARVSVPVCDACQERLHVAAYAERLHS